MRIFPIGKQAEPLTLLCFIQKIKYWLELGFNLQPSIVFHNWFSAFPRWQKKGICLVSLVAMEGRQRSLFIMIKMKLVFMIYEQQGSLFSLFHYKGGKLYS